MCLWNSNLLSFKSRVLLENTHVFMSLNRTKLHVLAYSSLGHSVALWDGTISSFFYEFNSKLISVLCLRIRNNNARSLFYNAKAKISLFRIDEKHQASLSSCHVLTIYDRNCSKFKYIAWNLCSFIWWQPIQIQDMTDQWTKAFL